MKALFIGRFQPFHKGHLMAVDWICQRAEKLYIILAEDHNGENERNPYSKEQREMMIKNSLKVEGIDNYEIIYIPDFETVNGWVNAITNHVPEFDVVFTGNPWIENCFSSRGFKVNTQPLFDPEKYNATVIREKMKSGERWEDLVPPSVAEIIRES